MFKLNFLNRDSAKSDTGKGSLYFLIIILLGIGLLLITLGGNRESDTDHPIEQSEEERLALLCSSLSGVGECRVFIAWEERPISYGSKTEKVIVGIAVICEGGGSDAVRSRITSLIDGLYGVGANRIRVDKLK